MNLYPIVIVAIVLVADSLSFSLAPKLGLNDAWVSAIALGVPALLLAVMWLAVQRQVQRAHRMRTLLPILSAGRWSRMVRSLLVANHGLVVLGLGWLTVVRHWTGDLLLVDEFLAMLPPLVGIMVTWWIDWPVEKRLRDAMLIRRLDRGATVYPTPTRWGHMLMQLRLQMLPLLLPLLMIAALGELIASGARGIANDELRFWLSEGGTFVAAACVFLIAPFLARLLLSVRRLEDGPLREALMDVCRSHGVRVREVLVWQTGGVMINAAVMGLIAPLRYVLMTDALLDTMNREQLLAVMAHEIGHVRRHHMPWLVVALLATLFIASAVVMIPLLILYWIGIPWASESGVLDTVTTAGVLGLAFVGFGWICRRFERQADTFSVQHMSEFGAPFSVEINDDQMADGAATLTTPDDDEVEIAPVADPVSPDGRITAASVSIMQSALETIAQLNMVDPHRASWRHGSIVWRQQYLQGLIDRPARQLPIDRTVRWIKVAAALVMTSAVILQIVWTSAAHQRNDESDTSWVRAPAEIMNVQIGVAEH